MKRIAFILGPLALAALTGCAQSSTPVEQEATSSTDRPSSIQVDSQGRKYIVDPSKILSGGPPKDGIPSIDSPEFISVSEADQWIQDNELVLAINYRGVKRVYPLQILVTCCPLCGSGIAYLRELGGSPPIPIPRH